MGPREGSRVVRVRALRHRGVPRTRPSRRAPRGAAQRPTGEEALDDPRKPRRGGGGSANSRRRRPGGGATETPPPGTTPRSEERSRLAEDPGTTAARAPRDGGDASGPASLNSTFSTANAPPPGTQRRPPKAPPKDPNDTPRPPRDAAALLPPRASPRRGLLRSAPRATRRRRRIRREGTPTPQTLCRTADDPARRRPRRRAPDRSAPTPRPARSDPRAHHVVPHVQNLKRLVGAHPLQ